MSGLTRFFFGL